jgi:protein SCO1
MQRPILLLLAFVTILVVTPSIHAQMAYGKAPRIKRDPQLPEGVGVEQKHGAQLPLDETFTDHDGKAITLRDAIGGKPTILVLGYASCPKLCNELLNATVKELRALNRLGLVAGRDYQLVRISIDPKESHLFARKMRESYLEELDKRSPSEPGFWFLTANHGQGTDVVEARERVLRVANSIGFTFSADNQNDIDKAAAANDLKFFERTVRKSKDFVHASVLTIVTPSGTVSQYLHGLSRLNNSPDSPEEAGWTAEDIRQSLKVAGDGQLGSVTTRLAMLCFAYDEQSGHYQPVMRAMGLVALPFPFIIGLIAWTAWKRSRREKTMTSTLAVTN